MVHLNVDTVSVQFEFVIVYIIVPFSGQFCIQCSFCIHGSVVFCYRRISQFDAVVLNDVHA